MKQKSRESDERLLLWLALRDRGWTTPQLSARFGVNAAYIRKATNAVRQEMDE